VSVAIIKATDAYYQSFGVTRKIKFGEKFLLKVRRRTEITIQTDRVLTTANVNPAIYADCPACARQARMLTADEAAKTARVNSRTIYRLVENGQLHFQEMPEGSLLICLASLSAVETEKLSGETK
jgi:excisionase family DNA binding protein